MDCSVVREAISAGLDGEASPIADEIVSNHLTRCDDCQSWQAAAVGAHRSVRVAVAPDMPDLTSAVLVAIGNRKPASEPGLRACRWLLAICAVLQMVTGLPALFQASGSLLHLDHELGAWDIALAFAFLIVAVQPSRAWGMLPFMAVLALVMSFTAVADISAGAVDISRESTHITEMLGVVLTFVVTRLNPSAASQRISII